MIEGGWLRGRSATDRVSRIERVPFEKVTPRVLQHVSISRTLYGHSRQVKPNDRAPDVARRQAEATTCDDVNDSLSAAAAGYWLTGGVTESFAAQPGANERINIAMIGCGGRAGVASDPRSPADASPRLAGLHAVGG